MLALSALLVSAPLAALAGAPFQGSVRHRHAEHARHARDTAYSRRGQTFTLVDSYSGSNFFDGWDFFSDEDPTHGSVNYLTKDAAMGAGLAYVQSDGTAVIKVDNYSDVAAGGNRNSVRIGSTKSYNQGLFIADIYDMPHGCGVWPAFWMVASDASWPEGGEIDIIEGVNDQSTNQLTLHAGAGCLLQNTRATLGNIVSTTCTSADGANAGCAYVLPDTSSFGHGFNEIGGGVYATLWDDAAITMWFFPRSAIPADIAAGAPAPANWSTPAAHFPNTQCDIGAHFQAQSIIFDITLCGDWAGSSYGSSTCPGTCAEAVANKTNFNVAAWKIKSVQIYQ